MFDTIGKILQVFNRFEAKLEKIEKKQLIKIKYYEKQIAALEKHISMAEKEVDRCRAMKANLRKLTT